MRKAGISLNVLKQGVKIYEHFPREVEERRKQLYPIVRRLSDQGEKVSLVRDRLYINNKQYNINNGEYTNKEGRKCYTRPMHPPAYPGPLAYHGEDTRDSCPTQYGPHPARQTIPHRPYNGRTLNFETPNRFGPLAPMDVDRTSQKRKERSPLDSDIYLKRQNTEVNQSNTQCVENNGVLLIDRDSAIQPDAPDQGWANSQPIHRMEHISDPQGAPQNVINDTDT